MGDDNAELVDLREQLEEKELEITQIMAELEQNEQDQEELEQSNLNMKRQLDAETAKLKTMEQ